jgi:hypothetical protein
MTGAAPVVVDGLSQAEPWRGPIRRGHEGRRLPGDHSAKRVLVLVQERPSGRRIGLPGPRLGAVERVECLLGRLVEQAHAEDPAHEVDEELKHR